MRSTLKAICFIAALLVALGASAAAASPLLSADDMSTLRGGWLGGPTLRCANKWCGPASGVPESCIPGVSHRCTPYDPEMACNNHQRTGGYVWACGSYATGDTCQQGDVTPCGSYGYCYCDVHELCRVEVTVLYGYKPCD